MLGLFDFQTCDDIVTALRRNHDVELLSVSRYPNHSMPPRFTVWSNACQEEFGYQISLLEWSGIYRNPSMIELIARRLGEAIDTRLTEKGQCQHKRKTRKLSPEGNVYDVCVDCGEWIAVYASPHYPDKD